MNRYTVDQIDLLISECDEWIKRVEQVTAGDATSQIVLARYSRSLVAFKVILQDAKDRPYTETSLDAIRVALGFELLEEALDRAAEEDTPQGGKHTRTYTEEDAGEANERLWYCQVCKKFISRNDYYEHRSGKAHQRPSADE